MKYYPFFVFYTAVAVLDRIIIEIYDQM